MKRFATPSLVLFAILLQLFSSQKIGAQIKWDFDGGTGTASPIASSIPPNIAVSDMSAGNANGSTPLITNTSPSGVYTGASANYNATVSVVTGVFAASSTYFQFTLTPAAGFQINLSALQFGTRSTGQGPNAYQIRTDVDAFGSSIAANSLSSNSTWSLKQHTTLNSGNGVVGALNTAVVVRIYGYSPNSPVASTPNWRIDDVAVTATLIPAITLNPSSSSVCSGNTASFTVAASSNPTSYTWQYSPDGTTWTTIDASTAASTYTTYTTSTLNVGNITASLNGYRYRAAATNGAGTSAYSAAATLTAYTGTWNGAASSAFALSTNWTGCPPAAGINSTLPTGAANMPVLVTGVGTLNNITLQSLASLTVTGTLEIGGTIANSGTLTATAGTVSMNGTIAQTIPAAAFSSNTVQNIIINNAQGLTLGGALKITGALTPTAGTLTTNGNLTLASDANGTAYIAAGSSTGNYINGTVTVQRYIPCGGLASATPSKRAYRFLGHPFSSAIAVGQLKATGGIDITGSGGSANGFTATASNNPSVFLYSTATGNGGTNDPGWAAFTDANNVTNGNANAWNQYQGIRAFVRGTQGQGLDGSTNYTVGSPTLSLTGTLNMGNKTVSLVAGGANWNLVGNPYACPVNLNLVTRSNTSNFIYVWKVDQGTRGGYSVAQDIASAAYNLPAGSAFFVQATGSSPSMLFHEADKTATATSDAVFRTANTGNTLKLKLESADGSIFWDELHIRFNKAYKDDAEAGNDGPKLMNPDVSLYSISSDNGKLSLDSRPIKDGASMPLGLATTQIRGFRLTISELDRTVTDMATDYFLKDHFLNTLTKLDAGTVYDFATTADAQSQGEQRFELVQKVVPATININSSFLVSLSPNPVQDILHIHYEGLADDEPTSLQIVDANGKTVKMMELGKTVSGNQMMAVKGWASGMYHVQLLNGSNKQVQTIIKQ